MSDEGKSYRQILRSTSIIGGASVINILIGLVRVKVAAVLLGPAGIGLIGLFNNLIGTAANVAAIGTGTVGTRQIAEAAGREDAGAVAAARRALFWGTLALAATGSLVFWLLRGTLAAHVLNDPALSDEVGWLALGVGLTVASGSQGALLNGLRRIGDLARVSVYSAAIATVLGIGALLFWHEKGLLVYLLMTPVASFVVGHWYVARLPKLDVPPTPLRQMTQQWAMLARLGMAFMLAGLAMTVGQLIVRTMVQRELGVDALGYFEASWVISMTYISFVLRAMGTDYYPRLTAVIHDHAAVNRLVNEQTEVALLLAGPVFLVMLGLAPWAVELMYSSKFSEAVTVLRWQILGDILKVSSWPLGYIILASGDGRTFLICETFAMTVFTLIVWSILPYMGIEATGVGFLVMYVFYLPMVYWIAKKRTGLRWTSNIFFSIFILMASGIFLGGIGAWNKYFGAILSLIIASIFCAFSLNRLIKISSIPISLIKIINKYQKICFVGKNRKP